jgi:hypothetical protein
MPRSIQDERAEMFNHKTTRIGILFAVLILALAAVGIGSALWSETITIDGEVTTGNVDVEFGFVFADDLGASGMCDFSGTPDALIVTMAEAYPTYECHLQFDVFNVGSIPVLVDEPVWAMPAEVTVTVNGCYGDDYLLEPTLTTGACNVTFTVTDLAAESSFYSFHGDVFAEQVTLP